MQNLSRKHTLFNTFVGAFFLFLLAFCCVSAADQPASPDVSKPEIIKTPQKDFPFPSEQGTEIEDEADHFFKQFVKMLGTLGLLLAVLIFSSWVLKGMLNKQKQKLVSTDSIKVLERCQLSNNGFLYLIDVDNKTLLVGESAQSLTLLTTLSEGSEKT